MNPTSNPISDPFAGSYLALMLASLIATIVVVGVALSGAVGVALILGIVFGTLLNYATMSLNAQQNGSAVPPFWCSLPCAPVLVDAYHYWFTDDFNNFVNPCY
jgi:sterol desaturase/sphingolipid hydroxylase (fatty acid hydroxylase superfamily)